MGWFQKTFRPTREQVEQQQLVANNRKADRVRREEERYKAEITRLKKQNELISLKTKVAKNKKELNKYSSIAGFGGGKPMFSGQMGTDKPKEWSIGEKEKGWKFGR